MQLPLSLLEKATPTAFYLGLLTIPVSLFSQTLSGLLTSVRQFGWFAIVSVGQAASKLLFVLLFVSVLSWGVVGALLAVTAGGVLTIAATLLVLRWKCGIGWVKPAIHRAREVFFYGFRYYFGKISNTINFQIGTILLALFATKEEIGLFAVAVQIASRVMMIPDTLTTVLVPRIAGDTEGRSELVAQCARLTAVVCGALLLVLAVLARPIVIVLFSPDFLPAALLIQIIAVGVFVRCTCKVFVPYLAGTGRPGLVSTSVACGTVVNLAVLWWLLPIIGVPAAAVGMVAGYFTSSTLLLLAFRRLSGMKLWRIWKFKFSDWDVLLKTLPHASPRVAGTE